VGIIYLAALVLGLGTLTLQFVLSHAGGADAEADADADGVDDLSDGDADHALEAGSHGDVAHSALSTVGVFFSMRFWTFALMAFGMVGSLLHYLDLSGFGLSLALSITSGLVSGLSAALIFRALKGSVSSAMGQDDTIGKMAKVTVPLRKGSLGKVRVVVKGKQVDMLATTDAEAIQTGDEVVVVEFRGEHAFVEPIERSRGSDS
jgi:membrane protein implicated in regulation of membrane protease activity